MNIHTKFLSIFLCIVTLSFCLLGCSDKTDDAYIYFELPSIPDTLDPQTASADSELLIIKNIYEGLMRKDKDGNVVCGVAESYSLKGLTYTFKIRDSAVWSNDDPVTAHDFVFAFKRAVVPKNNAPFVSRLKSIKNAQQIINGKLASDQLAVKAIDNKTLQITLSKKDPDFLETLTTSIAMPCNEKVYIESAGKYALFKDYVVSNGSYRLTKWNKTSFGIRLYRNEKYTGDFYAKNAAIFITCNDKEHVSVKLKENNIDMAFVDSSYSKELTEFGLKSIDYQNICWVLTVKNDLSLNMRKALAQLVGGEVYSKNLPNGYTASKSIFPNVISKQKIVDGTVPYNISSGKKLYLSELSKLENNKFPENIKLYFYDNGTIKSVVTDIVGHWQNNLSAFVNIESVSAPELLVDELKNQTLPMAIFPIRADSDDVSEYLKKFGITYNKEKLGDIQTKLLKDSTIIPLAFQNTCIIYSPALTEVVTTSSDGYIDFSFIVKYENQN